MLRSFTTRPSRGGYEELLDDNAKSPYGNHGFHGKLRRVASVPVKLFSPSGKIPLEEMINRPTSSLADKHANEASKVHPIFALFGSSKKSKKATARPEFQRYINYLKEGGMLAQVCSQDTFPTVEMNGITPGFVAPPHRQDHGLLRRRTRRGGIYTGSIKL